jgi:hypothetical protein
MSKVTGFKDQDIPVINKILDELDKRVGVLDKGEPAASIATASTHKIPVQIGGKTYYILLTQ